MKKLLLAVSLVLSMTGCQDKNAKDITRANQIIDSVLDISIRQEGNMNWFNSHDQEALKGVVNDPKYGQIFDDGYIYHLHKTGDKRLEDLCLAFNHLAYRWTDNKDEFFKIIEKLPKGNARDTLSQKFQAAFMVLGERKYSSK